MKLDVGLPKLLNKKFLQHRTTACMRFKKKCVNNFQRLHFFFHPNFASSIIENKEVGETSHTRKRYPTYIFLLSSILSKFYLRTTTQNKIFPTIFEGE